jgi:methylated-DNA-[protein]-cysteine S-methyltransferase
LQQSVWAALATIAYGQTVSYAALAERVGRPAAVRAIAQAVGRNPWIILRPCHRVVGSSGSLTGFAAGLERKSALLALESRPGRQPAQSG